MKTIEIKISKGNTKLGNIPNVSTIPVKDCGNCDACKTDCYALKSWRMYPSVRNAWKHNSNAFRNNLDESMQSIRKYLDKKKPDYFRIHQAGDFLSQKHLNAWIKLAREYPETKFLAYTKMHSLNFRSKPDNFNILLSMFPGMAKPRKRLPIAWLQDGTETRISNNDFVCPGSCETCKHCYDNASDVVFFKH